MPPRQRAGTGGHEPARGTDEPRAESNANTAPQVEVRVGDHGDFERVVFEWPAATDYDVVHDAEQVTVAFSRRGRIDLSRVAEHLGRVVMDAWTENGAVTGRVTLRVLPNARVRSFSLEDGRVVAIDVFGGTAAQSLAPTASDRVQEVIQELRHALEQRDAVIESLLARVEQLERTVALSSNDLDRVTGGHAGPMPWVTNTPRPQARSPSVAAVEAPSGAPPPQPPPPPSQAAPSEQRPATTSPGQIPGSTGVRDRQETAQDQATEPGQVEIDEEAVERALDFTLVQEGALLLPVGRAEFTPSFTYTRRTDDFPVVLGPARCPGRGRAGGTSE